MSLEQPTPPLFYAAPHLDRAAHRRKEEAWLAQRRADPGTRVVFLTGLKVPVTGPEELPVLYAPTIGEYAATLPEESVFLGQEIGDGTAWFALDLGERPPPDGRLVELRAVSLFLPAAQASTLAYARGIAHWHRGHRFCGFCGTPTHPAQGGHLRICEGCGHHHFPRTDPAVIMLVTDGDRCLLGRSPRFPPGMYSTLAGFVEPGESLEQTVAREVREEAGIEVEAIFYQGSQPWPFPQSLMLGFRARARTTTLIVEPDELEDARWFERGELKDECSRPVRLPNPDSIARALVDGWLAEAG